MFRSIITVIAFAVLRLCGATVEYRVQRIRPSKATGEPSTKDGTTVKRTRSYREALKKYRSMRIGDDQTAVIRAVATTAQRHGSGVSAS